MKGRVRPSAFQSAITLIVGGLILLFALSLGGAMGGGFLVIFVVAVLLVLGFHAYNLFSKRGVALFEVDGGDAQAPPRQPTFGDRLRELEALRRDGLLTDEEYEQKRREVLTERW